MMAAKKVCNNRTLVGECPLWHPVERVLYWVDVQGRLILRKDVLKGSKTQQWSLAERIGCIALLPDGGLVGAMESGLFRFEFAGGNLQVSRGIVTNLGSGMRFNDGRIDPGGNFVVGSMADPNDGTPSGCLFRFDGIGLAKPLVKGLRIQNGVAWSPDGATMYLSDSHPDVQTVWAFDYDRESGVVSNRREFVDMRRYPGRPDGTTIDADGFCWIAANGGGRILRFSPDGRLVMELKLPANRPTRCAFGGADLATLFITTIGRDPVIGDLSQESNDGCLFALRPGVRGLPENPFLHLPGSAHVPVNRNPKL